MKPEKPWTRRWNSRLDLALTVLLGDTDTVLRATTRNVGLGGMCFATAEKAPPPAREFVATIEVDGGRRSLPPIPVRIVWSNDTRAGAAFEELTVEAIRALHETLKQARLAHKSSPPPRP